MSEKNCAAALTLDTDGAGVVEGLREQIAELELRLFRQEQTINALNTELRRGYVETMLYGKVPPAETPPEGGKGVCFEYPYYIVAALEPQDMSELFDASGNALLSNDDVDMVKEIIYSLIENMLGSCSIAYCCESDLAFCNILINIPDMESRPVAKLRTQVERQLESALKRLKKNYGIGLVAGLSATVKDYARLPEARVEAFRDLSRRRGENATTGSIVGRHMTRLRDEASVIAPPSLGKMDEQRSEAIQSQKKAAAKLEKRFYQCAINHDYAGARDMLLTLMDADLNAIGISLEAAKLRALNHMESVLNIMGHSTDVLNDGGEAEAGAIFLRDIEDKDSLAAQISDFFSMVERRSLQHEPSPNDRIQQIVAYITDNYSDCNMSLGLLCDRFGMNQSYLSRSFKQIMGIGVLEFIQKQRIAKAKELLESHDGSIDSIWSCIGYTNRRTFDRTFKRFEGITASMYRNGRM